MKKRNSRLLACALAVVLCMTAFSIPTFAAGYYASNENGNNTPPDAIESITVSTENVNLKPKQHIQHPCADARRQSDQH